jgi:hypothetical protein
MSFLTKVLKARSSGSRGSWLNRSDAGKLYNWTHPMNYIGAGWAGMNYVGGKLAGLDTKIKQDRYGFYVTDAPYMVGGDAGINMGYFSVQSSDRTNTIRHERGHRRQYSAWGADKYTGFFGLRLFGVGGGWPENDADKRAGTWEYDRGNGSMRSIMLLDMAKHKDYRQYQEDNFLVTHGYII